MSFRIHTSVIYHNKLIFPFTYNVCALLYVTYNICAIISPVVGIHTQPLLGMIGIKKRFKKWGQKRIEIKASSLSDIILTQKKQHEA